MMALLGRGAMRNLENCIRMMCVLSPRGVHAESTLVAMAYSDQRYARLWLILGSWGNSIDRRVAVRILKLIRSRVLMCYHGWEKRLAKPSNLLTRQQDLIRTTHRVPGSEVDQSAQII